MTIKETHALKQLTVRLTKAETEHAASVADVKTAQKREAELRRTKERLRQEVEDCKAGRGDPVVTEHAMLRYFERVLGYDLEEIRGMILNDQARAYIEQFGTGKIPCGGFRIVVQDRVVVTVEAA
jgi:hypothetical protein